MPEEVAGDSIWPLMGGLAMDLPPSWARHTFSRLRSEHWLLAGACG